ncbi:glycosyltransferase [Photobacterium leiognathi subsp. mandapamensis]
MEIVHIFRNLKYGGCQSLALSIMKNMGNDIRHVVVYLNEDDNTESCRSEFEKYTDKLLFVSQKDLSLNNVRSYILSLKTDKTVFLSWFYPYSLKLNLGKNAIHHAGMAALPFFSLQWLKNNIVFLLSRVTKKNGGKVIYASEHIKKSHKEKYILTPSNSSVIYNGISKELFKHRVSSSKKIKKVIMVGRLDGSKDFDSYIRLASIFNDRGLLFYIAGDGADRTRLEYLNDELNANVCFLGTVKDLHESLSSYDLMIFLNKNIEGFGNVIVESMLSKVLVISNNIGASPEIISNGKTGFLSNNFHSLVDILDSVINMQKEDYDRVVNAAFIDASNRFSAKLCSKSYLEEMTK